VEVHDTLAPNFGALFATNYRLHFAISSLTIPSNHHCTVTTDNSIELGICIPDSSECICTEQNMLFEATDAVLQNVPKYS
jgi:hypothetical protein